MSQIAKRIATEDQDHPSSIDDRAAYTFEHGSKKEETKMNRKNLILAAILVLGFVLLINGESQVKAADEWFVLGEKAIKSADQGVDIKSEGGFFKKDIKQVKLSVEGADVEISKLILRYNNRKDKEVTDIGVLKAGGQSTPMDAPGRKARLESVTVTYKILGNAETAAIKVWGYD